VKRGDKKGRSLKVGDALYMQWRLAIVHCSNPSDSFHTVLTIDSQLSELEFPT
jgi:hypothetical protein